MNARHEAWGIDGDERGEHEDEDELDKRVDDESDGGLKEGQGTSCVIGAGFEESGDGAVDFAFQVERRLGGTRFVVRGGFEGEGSCGIGFEFDLAVAGQDVEVSRGGFAQLEEDGGVVGFGEWCGDGMGSCPDEQRLGAGGVDVGRVEGVHVALNLVGGGIDGEFRGMDGFCDVLVAVSGEGEDDVVEFLTPSGDVLIFDAHEVFGDGFGGGGDFAREGGDEGEADAGEGGQKQEVCDDDREAPRDSEFSDMPLVHPCDEGFDEVDDDDGDDEGLEDLVEKGDEDEEDACGDEQQRMVFGEVGKFLEHGGLIRERGASGAWRRV